MAYHEAFPSAELANEVERLWCIEGPPSLDGFERVLPHGLIEIVINLSDGELRCYDRILPTATRRRGPLLSGVQRSYFVVDTRQLDAMVGVRLKPGGAWRLFGLPAALLADDHVDLAEVGGPEIANWTEQLAVPRSAAGRLRLLDGLLLRAARRRRDSHPAVGWAVEQLRRYPDSARIGDLAAEASLSMRRFSELFIREVGVNPKGFARIRRFRSVIGRLQQRGGEIDWSALSLESGYADQAHLIRDFREFSGLTPTAYRAQGSPVQPVHAYAGGPV
jgi:AraC-like DNA-binding protein